MNKRLRAVTAVNELTSDRTYQAHNILLDKAVRYMLEYVDELENRVAELEQREDPMDYFRPIGGR